jgi:hypothetical protein
MRVRSSERACHAVVGDANIYNQIATAGRVRQVVGDLEISALQARARGNNPLGLLNLCPVGPKRGPSCVLLIAEFYLVDRGLRHRLPGFSSMGRLVILP